MSVSFMVDYHYYSIGHGDFLHAFFSTVAYNLEKNNWGSRFPVIMNKLYDGVIDPEDLNNALEELSIIKNELKAYGPEKVVWDIDDLSKQPPWGDNISEDITDLSNYFVTDEGEDFLTVFLRALKRAKKKKIKIELV